MSIPATKVVKMKGTKIVPVTLPPPPPLPTYLCEKKYTSKSDKIFQVRLPEEVIFLVSASKKAVKKELSKVLSKQQMKSIKWIACVE